MNIKKVASKEEFVDRSYSNGKEIKRTKIPNIANAPMEKADDADCCFPSDCQCCVSSIFFENRTKNES